VIHAARAQPRRDTGLGHTPPPGIPHLRDLRALGLFDPGREPLDLLTLGITGRHL
jgi:hypothetical protein